MKHKILKSELPRMALCTTKKIISDVPKEIYDNRDKIKNGKSQIITYLIADTRDAYSNVIFVCGRPRSGKTRFAVTLANILSQYLYYERFDAEKYFFVMNPRDMLNAIDDEGYKIYVLDESGATSSGINKREFWGKMSQLFDYILQTQGLLVNIYIFILPFAADLTHDIKKYATFICSTKKRGLVKIQKVYKKEENLVLEIKEFHRVFIENLTFQAKDLPDNIWENVEKRVNIIKNETRKERIMINENNGKGNKWYDDKNLNNIEGENMIETGDTGKLEEGEDE